METGSFSMFSLCIYAISAFCVLNNLKTVKSLVRFGNLLICGHEIKEGRSPSCIEADIDLTFNLGQFSFNHGKKYMPI